MHMKKFVYSLAALLCLAACNKEKELVIADHGPTQTITYDQSALMGSVVNFSVNLQDNIALSTLKVALLFDETVVADTTIRTKTTGTYEGYLKVPFEKNIPDGEATLRVVSQNIQFGTTTDEKAVAVSRPDFAYLTLLVNGSEYRMNRTGRNTYETDGQFNGETDATIVTPAIDADGRTISFGFSGNAGIVPAAKGLIPFSSTAANYPISFNTLTWEGAPFVSIKFNGVDARMADATTYVAVLDIAKGDKITFEGAPFGLDQMELDPDFFTQEGTFNAVDGLYKVSIFLDSQYFLVERMKNDSDYADIDTGAIWMIGEAGHYGKPVAVSAGWNTEVGPMCLAQVEPGVFQLTQVAGTQLGSLNSLNVKLFHQHGWGGEFGGGSYAAVESDLIYAGESDGNIHLIEGQKLEMGGIYRFTVDITGGTSAAVLKFEKIGQNEVEAEKIAVNGVEAEMVGADVYTATVALTQGTAVSITGVEDINAFWFDPDFFAKGAFQAVDGTYGITLNTAKQTVTAARVNAAGGAPNLEEGGLYLKGWGVAATVMDADQVGWPSPGGYQMAQVAPGKFQFTGIAVDEHDGTTVGGRFRYDYLSIKYYSNNEWSGETSKGLTIGGNAAALLSQGDDGNLVLASNLEEGAIYRLTVDFSGVTISGGSFTGTETITFDKVDENEGAVLVNGTKADMVDNGLYSVSVALTQGSAVSISGISGLESFWFDPDFFVDGKFNAVDGTYTVTIDESLKVVQARRQGANDLENGGLYIQGWGIAAIYMDGGQVGWPGSGAYQMAQVSPGVYQMTGVAVTEHDPRIGGRFRTDYWSVKYFFQDGWGGEASKGVTISGNAAANLTQGGDGNLGLASDLEEGATYRLTIDFTGVTVSGSSVEGIEAVKFEKL